MTNALHTNIKFEDLTFEKQEAIIKIVYDKLQVQAEQEGKEFLTRAWHDPKPKTWQEAYCRIYAIETHNWEDYEAGTDKAEIPPFMWESWQEEHVRQIAEEKAKLSLIKSEVEITL